MALETANFISDLVAANPTATDPKSQGDDHVRMVKACVKATFPNFTAAALNSTQAAIDTAVKAFTANAAAPAGSVAVDASGNLLVATAAAGGGKVAINQGTTGAGINLFSTNGTNAVLSMTQLGVVGCTINAVNAGLSFGVDGSNGTTERMRLDGVGRFIVGSASILSGIDARVSVRNATAAYGQHIQVDSNGGGAMFFSTASNGGVGSIVLTSTTTAYNTVSDYRFKLNQAPLLNSGRFIDALKPKTWIWSQDGSNGVGFVAHEFQEVSPSSVSGAKDAVNEDGTPHMQAMQASSPEVMANIVAELQCLRARLAALETGHIA